MPTQVDLVVKAHNGTTDVTYTAIQPSAGTKSAPAVWRNSAVGVSPGTHPSITHFSESNNNGSVRRSVGKYVYPVGRLLADTGSLVQDVTSKVTIDLTVQAPQNIAQSIVDEAVSQALNSFVAIKTGIRTTSNYV